MASNYLASGVGAEAASELDTVQNQKPPLLVDLDRSLIRTDLLLETALAYLAGNPLGIFRLLAWALRGRAYLKRRLAEAVDLDVQLLPVHDEVAALASRAKREGRQVYLVTASDELLATRVSAQFAFLDGVISSDGSNNLKGLRKAQVVTERFPGGFDYVGDSRADLHVWRHAREIIVVEPSPSVLRSVSNLRKPTSVIARKPRLPALLKAARLHQWSKNTLVFLPAILSGQIAHLDTAVACLLAFLALGLVAAGTYLVNDLFDLSHDRRHWSKRHRPIASGELPIGMAATAAAISITSGLAIGLAIGTGVAIVLAAYLVLTLAYSMHIKRVPILDVVTLACLFTLRLALGIAAAQVVASPWLLVFSMFLFTSLSTAKRFTEIQRTAIKGETAVNGRGYLAVDAPMVLGLGLAAGTASILIMVLYLIFDAFSRDFYGNPHWLWLFPVILFLWISRVWLVGQRGELNDDPVAFALKDRQSLILGGIMAVAFVLAWAGAPL
jgi:4-hydroxybenzoate polyprenyltransferase/phosphoserine phosphatase